jgi:hypothetical protein
VDRRNVAIEYLWANDRLEQLPALAADLVRQRVSLIVGFLPRLLDIRLLWPLSYPPTRYPTDPRNAGRVRPFLELSNLLKNRSCPGWAGGFAKLSL